MKPLETKKPPRRILINNENHLNSFPSNSIKTAKYNIFTFLPLSIVYQFNSYFNIFFLFTAVLLSIPEISPIGPGNSISPFLFVILLSVIREAIEDIKKSKYDKTYNNSFSLQYDVDKDCFVAVKWKDIKVGRVIKVLRNEVIPADLILMKSSAENGFCYLQTTNLDGESALKSRESLLLFQKIFKTEKDLKLKVVGSIDVDQPNENIYMIEGKINIGDQIHECFDINNILLRGGTLKNVDCIYGLVIYTGRDTKIMKNIKNGSRKLSSIDIVLNRIVIYVIFITFLVCVVCTTLGLMFWSRNIPTSKNIESKADYIYYSYSSNGKENFGLELIKTFTAFYTIFNTFIPISLIITLEVVKGFQVFMIDRDPLMAEHQGEKLKILSMKLQEDLGSVKYVFTDKTGTLTRNEMEFKACSILSKLFDEEKSEDLILNERNERKSIFSKDFDTSHLIQALHYDMPIEIDGLEEEVSPFSSLKEAVIEFFLNIAINHNVLTEIDSYTKEKIYTGSNPDEVVLVQAAKELGIEFIERVGNKTTINIFGQIISFEILHRFEFTSARMRSSIIVRNQDNQLKLYMKGADSVLLKKIDDFSKNFLYTSTKSHLDKFAKSGLRTLCYSMKELDIRSFEKWEEAYNIMKQRAVTDKSLNSVLDETIAELENEMLLIGVTGLEDKLQDDVRNNLQDFIEAGINVWMLTGDKLDTAESIGYSCKLFNDDTEVFKIKASNDKNETLTRLKEILNKMDLFEHEMLSYKIEKRIKKKRPELNNRDNINLIEKIRGSMIKNIIEENIEGDNFDVCPSNKYLNDIDENNFFEKPIKTKVEKNAISSKRHPDKQYQKVFNTIGYKSADRFFILKKHRKNSDAIYSNGKMMNFQQMNLQIIDENMQFIGSELDSFHNVVKLNFRRKNTLENYKPHIKQRPTSSNPAYRFKMKKKEIEENLSEDLDEVSIIQYMVDRNFFDDDNKDLDNLTFYNQLKSYVNHNNINEEGAHVINVMPPLPQERDDRAIEIHSISHDNIINEFSHYKFEQPTVKKESQIQIIKDTKLPYHKTSNTSIKNQYSITRKESKSLTTMGYPNLDFTNLYEDYKKKLKRLETPKPLKIFNFDFKHEDKDEKFLSKNFGLILEESAISQCISEEISPLFLECIKNTRSVICCRCAPIQKSDVVGFIRNTTGKVTLAIGDGGNDVSMIKTANVGVGIFGKEGYQAAFNSDYAISQFRYLKPLLFVHGRFSLIRNSYYVNFFFYKNLMFTLAQLWFSFFNGFSGTLLWDDWYYLGYNSFLSTIPVSCRMLFEEDLDIKFENDPNKLILNNLVPDLYRENRERKPFNIPKFFFVFFCGAIHSLILYFIPYFMMTNGILDETGRNASVWNHSLMSYFSLIILQYCVIIEDSFYFSGYVFIVHSIQFVVFTLFILVHNYTNAGEISGIFIDIVFNLQFWLTVIITVYISILPFLISRRIEILFSDSLVNNLRHRLYENHFDRKKYTKKLNEMQKFIRTFAKVKKISMLDENYVPDNLADKKIKDFVETYRSTKLQKMNKSHNNMKNDDMTNNRDSKFVNIKKNLSSNNFRKNNFNSEYNSNSEMIDQRLLIMKDNDNKKTTDPGIPRVNNDDEIVQNEIYERNISKKRSFFEILEINSNDKLEKIKK